MKSLTRIASKLPKFLLLVLFLTLAPAALAINTWYVDGVNGNDNNDCNTPQTACKTIGHAIALASSGDTIMVAPATYTENLQINFSLKIIGSDAATTIVDGGGFTVLFINYQENVVVLSKLTIRNGYNGGSGGGIVNGGKLTINNSTISGNSAGGYGGGILNEGKLTINRSTISGNSAPYGGGGIFNEYGTLTINRSTISGNSTGMSGGGIVNYVSKLTINNSTITGNSASKHGAGILSESGTLTINNSTISGNSGGGIYFFGGSAILQNTIVANNWRGNCYSSINSSITSNGYNLSSDSTCNFNRPGDMNNTKPGIGKLGYHGGPTQTILLLEGSPAIDAGNPNGCTDGNGNLLKTDQRGFPRPDKEDTSGCDIGAFEKQSD